MNTVIALANLKASIARTDDERLKNIDLESSYWAKSLFKRVGFIKRACTMSRPEIPEGARKEAAFLFHYQIASDVEKQNTPPSLLLNFDQMPAKHAPVSSRTLAKKNSKSQ